MFIYELKSCLIPRFHEIYNFRTFYNRFHEIYKFTCRYTKINGFKRKINIL